MLFQLWIIVDVDGTSTSVNEIRKEKLQVIVWWHRSLEVVCVEVYGGWHLVVTGDSKRCENVECSGDPKSKHVWV